MVFISYQAWRLGAKDGDWGPKVGTGGQRWGLGAKGGDWGQGWGLEAKGEDWGPMLHACMQVSPMRT